MHNLWGRTVVVVVVVVVADGARVQLTDGRAEFFFDVCVCDVCECVRVCIVFFDRRFVHTQTDKNSSSSSSSSERIDRERDQTNIDAHLLASSLYFFLSTKCTTCERQGSAATDGRAVRSSASSGKQRRW